jgi:hypothetical protein
MSNLRQNSHIILLLLVSQTTFGRELLLEDVLLSSRKNFPSVLEQVEKIAATEGEVQESRGAFDIKLKSEFLGDVSGYYDGLQSKTYLQSQIPMPGNIDLFGGYRRSFGAFPVYEGGLLTMDGGEIFAGARIDLLRNFGLDEQRLKLSLANRKLDLEKNKLQFQLLKIQEEAAKSYWDWVSSGFILATFEGLYQISLDRDQAIQKRIKSGDLAEIFGVENQQNILQRKSDMQNAEQVFFNTAQQLAIYYRDQNGVSIVPAKENLPRSFQTDSESFENIPMDELLSKRPEIVQIEYEKSMVNDQVSFSKSQLLPRLDLQGQVKKDMGQGPVELRGNETELMLNFEFPFQNRKARGLTNRFEALQKALNYQQVLMKDQIRIRIVQNQKNLSIAREVIQNLEKEVKLAQALQSAEVKRWQNGDSDFFLINIREQTMARSQVQWAKTALFLQKSVAEFNNLTMKYPFNQ